MEHKLILFDIDGTLYDHDKKIPNSTMAAIKALQTQGHSVAIATGRAPFMVQSVLKRRVLRTMCHLMVSMSMQMVMSSMKIRSILKVLKRLNILHVNMIIQ